MLEGPIAQTAWSSIESCLFCCSRLLDLWVHDRELMFDLKVLTGFALILKSAPGTFSDAKQWQIRYMLCFSKTHWPRGNLISHLCLLILWLILALSLYQLTSYVLFLGSKNYSEYFLSQTLDVVFLFLIRVSEFLRFGTGWAMKQQSVSFLTIFFWEQIFLHLVE